MFILGFILGVFTGIVLMCLCITSKEADERIGDNNVKKI